MATKTRLNPAKRNQIIKLAREKIKSPTLALAEEKAYDALWAAIVIEISDLLPVADLMVLRKYGYTCKLGSGRGRTTVALSYKRTLDDGREWTQEIRARVPEHFEKVRILAKWASYYGGVVLPSESQSKLEIEAVAYQEARTAHASAVDSAMSTLIRVVNGAHYLDEVVAKWPAADHFKAEWGPPAPPTEIAIVADAVASFRAFKEAYHKESKLSTALGLVMADNGAAFTIPESMTEDFWGVLEAILIDWAIDRTGGA